MRTSLQRAACSRNFSLRICRCIQAQIKWLYLYAVSEEYQQMKNILAKIEESIIKTKDFKLLVELEKDGKIKLFVK